MGKEIIRILLIEDDPEDAVLINEKLADNRSKSYSITIAKDLQSAKNLLKKAKYSIILTDLGLTDSQGISTLEKIIDMETNTPVIVLTGLIDAEAGALAVQKGAQDYLVKGDFDHSQLERSIRYAIRRHHVETELRSSETRMRALFENGPDAYLIIDMKGNIKEANHVSEKLTGYNKKDIVGKSLIQNHIISKDQHPKVKKALAHLSLGMHLDAENYVITNYSGRELQVEARYTPVDVNGENVVLACLTDVTEKKQAAEKKREYYKNMEFLAKSSMEMIQFASSDQVINFISERVFNLIGKTGVVTIIEIDEAKDYYSLKSVKGNSKILRFTEKVFKKDLLNLKGKITAETRAQLGSDKMLNAKSSLSALSGGLLNEGSAKLIEGFMNLEEIYVLSLKRGGNLLGQVAIFNNKKLDSSTIQLIETFVAQASIVLERTTIQEALHESEERYKLLFDSSPQGIAVIGPEDQIMDHNKHLLDILNISAKNFESRPIPDYYEDPRERDRLFEILKKEGKVLNFETNMIKSDGEHFVGNISIKPITYQGEKSRIVVLSDISANKRDEEEKKKLTMAIEQTPSMVMITDASGIIEYVNPSFCKTTGFSVEEAVGNQPSLLKSGITPEGVYSELWQNVTKGKEWQGVFQNKKKNGEFFWVRCYVYPIFDNYQKLTHFVGITVDITEQKNAEEELIKAKDKAEESDRLKTAFLTNMSHEIRTPMNSIMGFSELLSSPDHDEDQKEEFVKIIQSRSKDLLNIINNLVDLSSLESGQINTSISRIKVSSLITSVFEKHIGTLKSGVSFNMKIPEGDKDMEISTDALHLTRILSNLVENAIKYTDNGKIIIGFEAKHNDCTFFVHDTGIGIDPDKSKIIFNRFMQAEVFDPEARGGNGLGLTISRYLTEILEGMIWFESKKGKGSSFFVSLPLKREDEHNSESLSAYSLEGSIDWSNKTILVAEDNFSNYLVLKQYLESSGIKMQHASNGMLAVEAFKSNGKFDMILMDLKMPLMNGYDAARVIRNINNEVPIVALIASTNKVSLEECFESGCNEILTKPLQLLELIRTMTRYL